MKKKKITRLYLIVPMIILLIFNFSPFNYSSMGGVITAEASSSVNAYFYLVDEDAFIKAYPNISLDGAYLTKIGTGKINYSGWILNNTTSAKKAIISAPKNCNYEWNYIISYDGKYYVSAPRPTSSTNNSSNTSDNSPSNNTNVSSTTHLLNREEILNANINSYPSTDSVKWDSFRKVGRDVADGVIPVSLLSDPVYTSMNLPSETRSDYMIGASRDNAHILGDTSSPNATTIVGIGSIYQTSDVTLQNKITICLGKIKVFGFNKNTKQWEIICSNPYPKDARLYYLPWSRATNVTVPITTYSDHISITVSGSELTGNTIHFWGERPKFDKNKYLYYATAYTYWADGSFKNNSLTAVNAIDVKPDKGEATVAQLFSSRGMSVTTNKKTIWSTTIPNSEYKAEWGKQLQSLFNQ